jgi:hypothetical protein
MFVLGGIMRRSVDFVLRNVGGENLLVPIGSKVMDLNGIIILNAVAAYIWELLALDLSLEELSDAVSAKFDVDKKTAQADIQTFFDISNQMGLWKS